MAYTNYRQRRGEALNKKNALFVVLVVSCGPGPRKPQPASDSGASDLGDAQVGLNGDASVYQEFVVDAGDLCVTPQTPSACLNPIAATSGCVENEDCGPHGSGNGLDDNCDGRVDELCPCTPGDVESCFLGPPGKHKIGGCTDGQQTCEFNGEFSIWGDCKGSISPRAESCNMRDDDCDGCVDDGLCCNAPIMCPSPGDPRIADVQPFSDLVLKGELFFPGYATSWSWVVQGGPCDRLFLSPGATPQPTADMPLPQSFTLSNADTRDATIHFTLSGDYTITLSVVSGSDGHSYTCTWVQHVGGPGVRVELCWDHTGPDPDNTNNLDLDLHLHRPGTKSDWFGSDDCYFNNCKGGLYSINWGYFSSPGAICNTMGVCKNPRLDIDNMKEIAKPENINVDSPQDGEVFRVMVHYWAGELTEHPLVNVYCGGVLKTTFGQAPNQVSGFNLGLGMLGIGQMWRVADVQANVDSMTQVTDCTVTALHPEGQPLQYNVVTDYRNHDVSY